MANQYIQQKVLNIIIHQRNENENDNKIPLYTPKEWLKLKSLKILNAYQDMEQMKLSYTDEGSIKWCHCFQKLLGSFYEVHLYLSYDLKFHSQIFTQNKYISTKKSVHGFIHNSSKLETTQIPINIIRNKQIHVFIQQNTYYKKK